MQPEVINLIAHQIGVLSIDESKKNVKTYDINHVVCGMLWSEKQEKNRAAVRHGHWDMSYGHQYQVSMQKRYGIECPFVLSKRLCENIGYSLYFKLLGISSFLYTTQHLFELSGKILFALMPNY